MGDALCMERRRWRSARSTVKPRTLADPDLAWPGLVL